MYAIRYVLLLSAVIFCSIAASGQITGIKISGDTCNSLTLDLQATGTSSSPYFFWNFGDPASGTNDTATITGASPVPYPTHTFSGPGVYTVCVSLQEPGDPVTTVCRTISIGLCCSGVIQARDTCLANGTSFSMLSSAGITAISWTFGDPASGGANTSSSLTPTHIFSAVGSYTVTASGTAPCGIFTVSYPITIVNCSSAPPCTGTISMRDSCIQNGSTFSINSSSAISAVFWSFGDPASGSANTSALATPVHVFTGVGNFTITATVVAACGTFTASYTATITNCITVPPPQPCSASIAYRDSCAGNTASFQITANSVVNSVAWNFGDPASGSLNAAATKSAGHRFDKPGSYTVTATVIMACGSVVATRDINIVSCVREPEGCSFVLPSGFTPNGDGQNDVFYVRSEDLRTVKTMRIYNRWGQLIFSSENVSPNDAAGGWDGKYLGQGCAPDIYMYFVEGICNSGKEVMSKGDIMIIR